MLVRLPKLKKRQLTYKQKKQPKQSLGKEGEEKAVSFLISQHYKILDTNVRLKNHEIDIIAKDQKYNELVFIEVKTRNSTDFGDPSKAVGRDKIRSMKYVAAAYRNYMHLYNLDYRFDIITVTPDGIDHFKNVTWNF